VLTHTRLLVAGLMAALVGSIAMAAMPPPKGVEDFGMKGTIGPYPIAVIVRVRDEVQIIAAHYSYVSKKVPIPLISHMQGEEVILQEPGAGTFHLHFVTNDPSAQHPLTFWTSTGLTGVWTKNGRSLPVKIGFEQTGQDLEDCAFYPVELTSVAGPHFHNPGCEYTPDRKALDACISRPFTSDNAVVACISRAASTCRQDQFNMNMCVGNLSNYLDQSIQDRLHRSGTKSTMDAIAYKHWINSRQASCEKNSDFSPDGSGYGADIAFCMSDEMLRLLQKKLVVTAQPFGADARHER